MDNQAIGTRHPSLTFPKPGWLQVFQTRSASGREAGACLATFAQLGYNEKGSVSALAFSQDGRYLYSGASDGTLAAWRLDWVDSAALGVGKGIRKGFL